MIEEFLAGDKPPRAVKMPPVYVFFFHKKGFIHCLSLKDFILCIMCVCAHENVYLISINAPFPL
jgi:hypothetical protein